MLVKFVLELDMKPFGDTDRMLLLFTFAPVGLFNLPEIAIMPALISDPPEILLNMPLHVCVELLIKVPELVTVVLFVKFAEFVNVPALLNVLPILLKKLPPKSTVQFAPIALVAVPVFVKVCGELNKPDKLFTVPTLLKGANCCQVP